MALEEMLVQLKKCEPLCLAPATRCWTGCQAPQERVSFGKIPSKITWENMGWVIWLFENQPIFLLDHHDHIYISNSGSFHMLQVPETTLSPLSVLAWICTGQNKLQPVGRCSSHHHVFNWNPIIWQENLRPRNRVEPQITVLDWLLTTGYESEVVEAGWP